MRPVEVIRLAADRFGEARMRAWCARLVAGVRTEDRIPMEWLGGTPGWAPYWTRVWGARGLLHLGTADDPGVERAILDALADEHWRVREMALKVIARHAIDDQEGRVDALVDDAVARVRAQVWRVLGRVERP